MEVDEIYIDDELPREVTCEIGTLFQKVCIVLAQIQSSRPGFDVIRALRTELHKYYGIVHPQDVYHHRINTMSLTVFSDIRNIAETFLEEREKEDVRMYMEEIDRLIDQYM